MYLLLGTNLGDRKLNFQQAIACIKKELGLILFQSSIYETEPWGVMDQPNYWNQVLKVETRLSPQDVLTHIHAIEKQLGRERRIQWEARLIDIDILYIDDQVINDDNLIVPHPRLSERRFVLTPLAEIAPDFVHPVLKKTNLQLLADCSDSLHVTKIAL